MNNLIEIVAKAIESEIPEDGTVFDQDEVVNRQAIAVIKALNLDPMKERQNSASIEDHILRERFRCHAIVMNRCYAYKTLSYHQIAAALYGAAFEIDATTLGIKKETTT